MDYSGSLNLQNQKSVRKKALIIVYYWPPAGGPGVQRWLKFVKYLRDFEVEPIVYVPKNPNYPLYDATLEDEIPNGITILRKPIKEPYKLASLFSKKKSKSISKGIIPQRKQQTLIDKLLLYIRGNFFIPDARKNWVKPSVEFLSQYLIENDIDTIITTGPPHSLHLIGLKLKKELGLKWLADFRDPWTTIGYHKQLKLSNSSKRKHKALESQVLNTADNIIVTSFKTKSEFEAITSKPISVITNGYDVETVEPIALDSEFSLSHIGSLLSERNPSVLWQALSDLIGENKEFGDEFKLKLIGAVSNSVLKSIREHQLIKYTELVPYVKHNAAIKLQRSSQVLLLIEIDSEDTKCIIPGKLFEYMVSHRPIIAIGPEDSDVSQIIKSTNTGKYFNYNDYNALKTTILEYYRAFKAKDLQTYPIGLEQYSRKSLTRSLAELILN